jgi:UTP:GlnB (protein PII) uridylyltransferase
MIAAWAISQKLWDAPRKSLIDQCAEELSDAMRQEMETDPQGRTVHAMRCAKIAEKDAEGNLVQQTLWFDTKSRTTKLMKISQQQWRNSILGECRQHRIEEQSFNDNNLEGDTIQHSLNFEDDLLDSAHGTSYNPPPPPDDDDDQDDS